VTCLLISQTCVDLNNVHKPIGYTMTVLWCCFFSDEYGVPMWNTAHIADSATSTSEWTQQLQVHSPES